MKIRLDKFLADMGYGTRSEVKKEIARGNVRVNGLPARKPETKIDTEKDKVMYRDQSAVYEKYEYYMLNKPAGVISAATDKKEKTVLDLIGEKQRKDLFPVGRLDRDTEGLLLITNDGELAHRLLSPKKHVDKVYYVKVQGRLTAEDEERLAEGIDIGEARPALPAGLAIPHGDHQLAIAQLPDQADHLLLLDAQGRQGLSGPVSFHASSLLFQTKSARPARHRTGATHCCRSIR